MKTTAKICLYLGLFYLPIPFIYGYFTDWDEPVGTVGLALSSAFGFMIWGYLTITAKKLAYMPGDNADGEISELEGEYGFFSPHSWWPLWLAAALSLTSLGLAVGWWLVMVSAPLVLIAVVGWVFEYFRGMDAV